MMILKSFLTLYINHFEQDLFSFLLLIFLLNYNSKFVDKYYKKQGHISLYIYLTI